MGEASMTYREVRFLIHDHSVECYVFIEAHGDCPIGIQGWHYKHFVDGVERAVIDLPLIIKDYVNDACMWPQQAPPK